MKRRLTPLLLAPLLASLLGTRAAQAQPNPAGRWITFETPHFHLHVRAEQRAEGLRAARVAEAAWARLARELEPPRSAIEIVLTDNTDATDGYATVSPWPLVVAYDASPVSSIAFANYDAWLDFVLTHELVHVFHLDLARGWWRVPRAVFGRVVFPNVLTPDWVIEGLAVYYETRLTPRGRLTGSYYPGIVAAQRAEGGPMPLDRAGPLGPSWPGELKPYVFGSGFLEWVAATRGDSVLPRFARATAGAPIPYLGLNGALASAGGPTITAGWRAWQHELAATQGAADKAAGGTILIHGLRIPVTPRVSRDGRTILFVRYDGRDDPYVATLERGTGRVHDVTRFNGFGGVAWSDSGAVMSQLDLTDPYTMRSDLWSVDTASGAERRLTVGARLQDPDVGPDGETVAMQLVVGGTRLVRLDSTGVVPLTDSEPGVEWAQPRWSPDGRLIAALRMREGRRDLMLLGRDGVPVRQLTGDSATNDAPAFSPDGRWLLWSGEVTGRAQIYATRADTLTGRWWRVTEEPFGAYAPAPAADSVFYLALHDDGLALAAVPFDTLRWTALAADTWPEPSPPAPPLVKPGGSDDPAPVRAEHPYRPWPTLAPRYWLPVAEAASGATWLGARTSGADVLGRHSYDAALSFGAGGAARSWRGHVGYAYARLVPWVLDASYSRDLAVVDTVPGGGAATCCNVDEDAALGASWVHARWRWQVRARAGAEYERNGGIRRAGGVLSAAAWHLTQPEYAISLQTGWRAAALVRERWRTDTALAYQEALAAGAAYQALPLGGFARPVLAVTATAGRLGGSDRVVYGVGGLTQRGVSVLPGLDLGGSGPTFPVRGYPSNAILGRAAASGSAELRLPLALVERGLGLVPLFLDRMSVTVFADVGATWTPRGFASSLPTSSVIGSGGAELVVDLGVAYSVPLRLRAGAAWPFSQGRSVTGYVAVGPSF